MGEREQLAALLAKPTTALRRRYESSESWSWSVETDRAVWQELVRRGETGLRAPRPLPASEAFAEARVAPSAAPVSVVRQVVRGGYTGGSAGGVWGLVLGLVGGLALAAVRSAQLGPSGPHSGQFAGLLFFLYPMVGMIVAGTGGILLGALVGAVVGGRGASAVSQPAPSAAPVSGARQAVGGGCAGAAAGASAGFLLGIVGGLALAALKLKVQGPQGGHGPVGIELASFPMVASVVGVLGGAYVGALRGATAGKRRATARDRE